MSSIAVKPVGKSTRTAKFAQLEQKVTSPRKKVVHVERFLKMADKYTDIKVLTPEILREFMERIEVHKRIVYHSRLHRRLTFIITLSA